MPKRRIQQYNVKYFFTFLHLQPLIHHDLEIIRESAERRTARLHATLFLLNITNLSYYELPSGNAFCFISLLPVKICDAVVRIEVGPQIAVGGNDDKFVGVFEVIDAVSIFFFVLM